jgi:DeoR family transcriptional regulator of aga operon
MLNTDQRRSEILHAARQQPNLRVTGLARRFGVSAVTIRNDLRSLSDAGLLVRQHGGARLPQLPPPEVGMDDKRRLHRERKMQIGRHAATLVRPGDKLILDAGSTTLHLARLLHGVGPLSVFTNSLPIAADLAPQPHVELILAGGVLRHPSQSMQGPAAEASLERYLFDKLFLGVDGIDPDFGLSTHDEAEARLNARMIERARHVIVLADSSKFGRCALHRIATLERIDTLVSDASLAPGARAALAARGIEVIIAAGGPDAA